MEEASAQHHHTSVSQISSKSRSRSASRLIIPDVKESTSISRSIMQSNIPRTVSVIKPLGESGRKRSNSRGRTLTVQSSGTVALNKTLKRGNARSASKRSLSRSGTLKKSDNNIS